MSEKFSMGPRQHGTGGSKRRTSSFMPGPLEERISNVLSAVNTEWKTVVIALTLSERLGKTYWQIKQEFKDIVGDKYVPHEKNFLAMLERSLVPAGVASKTDFVDVWFLTDFGARYGAPIAAFSMYWSVKHRMSMCQILGHCSDADAKDSPFISAKLLEYIYLFPSAKRLADISAGTGIDEATLSTHLKRLSKVGLVDYDSSLFNRDGWKYRWLEERNPEEAANDKRIASRYPNLKRKIIEAVRAAPNGLTSKDLFKSTELGTLFKRHPYIVQWTLSSLEEYGYVSRLWKEGVKHTDVELLGLGREFVETWLLPVIGALRNGPELGELQTYVHDARCIAGAAAALYYPFSRAARSKPANERIMDLLSLIGRYELSHSMGPKTSEILDKQECKGSQYIRRAFERNLIERDTRGRGARWKLVPKGELVLRERNQCGSQPLQQIHTPGSASDSAEGSEGATP